MGVKELVASVANYTGVLDAYALARRKLTKSQVAILGYHRVCPATDRESHEAAEIVSPGSFREQIKYLSKHFEILSLDQLTAIVRSASPLPERAAVITLDDGYKNNYEYAYPLLQEYDIPATIFVVTGNLDNEELFWWDRVAYILKHTTKRQLDLGQLGNYRLESEGSRFHAIASIIEKLKRISDDKKNLLVDKLSRICEVKIQHHLGRGVLLSWEDVREMSRGGIAFGAHSVNHPILTNMPLERARDEIAESKRILERRLGKSVTHFSYPNGDYNTAIAELVASSGFTCAVSMGVGRLISPADDVYGLDRIFPDEDFARFKGMLSGLAGDKKRAWYGFRSN
jgi:peptidoglycan/xylan/chitin deacetylase (PgdA/CDA1 family)